MFVNSKNLCIYAGLLIILMLKCESSDLNFIEIGEAERANITAPQGIQLGEIMISPEVVSAAPREIMISPETVEEVGYVAGNLCETVEGVCKSAALIGLANFVYPGNNTLELVTTSLSSVSMFANLAKHSIRSHAFVVQESESRKELSASAGTPPAVEHQDSSLNNFRLHYLYMAEKISGKTASILGYLEVIGQYSAPVLTSYALTLHDNDVNKEHWLNAAYTLSATTALCYFYGILAQNLFNKRHQERLDLAEKAELPAPDSGDAI